MRLPLLDELDLNERLKSPWEPKEWQKRMKKGDEEFAHAAIRERQKVERRMIHGMKAWNLVSANVPDPKISNILLPVIRMICRVIISSLTVEVPGYNFKPKSKDDEALVELWQAANEHIDNGTSMLAEQEDFITNLIVTGNAAYEDRLETHYRIDREWVDGEWKLKPVRDRSRPRISTVSRHPMEYAFATWCKDPNGRVPVMFRDFYTWNEFAELAECKLPDGSFKYDNVEKVLPGYSVSFGENDKPSFQQENHDGVAIVTVQDPITNRNVKYANGVLIARPEHIALSKLVTIQRPTLSIARCLHTYESNFRAPMAWGTGFPHILRGLDALHQAIGNLTIDNWKNANTNVISVKNGTQSALDPDIAYLSNIRIEGEVLVSPLGRVNLADYAALKTTIDEMCIFLTGYNFRQLVGDPGKTAFEFQKRLEAQSQETEHLVRNLEHTALLNHGRVRLDFIINQMTEEEYEDITDENAMEKITMAIKEGKEPKEDYEFDDKGNPVQRKVRETVRIKGKRIEEEYDKKGRRTRDGYLDRGKANIDSDVPVVAAYFKPKYGEAPEVEVIGSRMHGLQKSLRFQKLQYLANYGRQRIAEANQNPNVEALQTNFDAKKMDEELVRSTETPLDSVMKAESSYDGKMTADDIRAKAEAMKKALSQTPNAQAAVPDAAQGLRSVRDVPPGGFGSLAEPGESTPVDAAAVAAGAS